MRRTRPPGDGYTPSSKTKGWIPVAVFFALALLIRGGRLLATDLAPDAAVSGVMGYAVLAGEFPLFFYGQKFMGSLDAFLAAPLYLLLGPSTLTANLCTPGAVPGGPLGDLPDLKAGRGDPRPYVGPAVPGCSDGVQSVLFDRREGFLSPGLFFIRPAHVDYPGTGEKSYSGSLPPLSALGDPGRPGRLDQLPERGPYRGLWGLFVDPDKTTKPAPIRSLGFRRRDTGRLAPAGLHRVSGDPRRGLDPTRERL